MRIDAETCRRGISGMGVMDSWRSGPTLSQTQERRPLGLLAVTVATDGRRANLRQSPISSAGTRHGHELRPTARWVLPANRGCAMWVSDRHDDEAVPHTGIGRVSYKTDDPPGGVVIQCHADMNNEESNPNMQAF